MIPYILKHNSISLFPAGGMPIIIDSTHMNFNAVRDAIRSNDFDAAIELASVKSYITKVSEGNVTVTDTEVIYKGTPIVSYLTNKMLTLANEGIDIKHFCKFLNNLMSNPSMTAREELYLFLEAADLPITEDGCFMAYKAVNSDFKDKYSKTFDNTPGASLRMPRAEVDDNRNRTCSYGFHVAAYGYARDFLASGGDKLVACKVNPIDVVSVPSDYKNQKLRTCAYQVLFEIPGAVEVFKDVHYYDTSVNQVTDTYDNSYMFGNYSDDEDDEYTFYDNDDDDDAI